MKEIETLSVIEKALLLMEWVLFKQLATDEVALIAIRTREVEYEGGEIVDPEGLTGSGVHFVVSGAIEISVEGSAVRTAREGEAVGSLAVLGEETTDETLKVLEPTHALVLSSADFERAIADHPEFALAVIRGLQTFVRDVKGGRYEIGKGD